MTRLVLLLVAVLFCGCGDDADGGGGKPRACPEACKGDTVCDPALGQCVRCVADADCDEGVCVGEGDAAACAQCRTEADCGGGHCVEHACVECTLATEAHDCGPYACDHRPDQLVCTETERGSLGRLAPCVVDAECETEFGYACVETEYAGEPDGTHCLRRASLGCQSPLTTLTSERRSVSSEVRERFCGFDMSAVGAEAVRAMIEGRTCTQGDDANCGPGGLCRTLLGAGARCTIPCGVAEECPTGGAASGCSGAGYCGTPG